MKIRTLFLSLSLTALSAYGLELPPQIGDHAVVQQASNVKLWGWAKPGATVSVTPSWSGKKVSAKAGTDGRWVVAVATPKASYTPFSIKITEGKESKTISDILVGEVWLASGQSNMEMPVGGFQCQPVEGSAEAVVSAAKLADKVRMAFSPRVDSDTLTRTVPGEWKVASTENVSKFSAHGFYFARELNRLLDVPVGVLCVSYGGSQVEGWMPRDLLDRFGYPERDTVMPPEAFPTCLYATKYNGMEYPLTDYTIRGFIWNQGEGNNGNPRYAELLAAMVERWRADRGDTSASLPFYQTENPPYGWDQPEADFAAFLRGQQYKAAEMIPNGGITCTTDLVYPHEVTIAHGSRKRELGERMAWQVAEKTYGIASMPWRAPQPEGHSVLPDGSVRLTFADTYGTLIMPTAPNRDYLPPHLLWTPESRCPDNNDPIPGFEVAGPDGKLYPAQARREGNAVIVSSDDVKEIKEVRYCFKNFAPSTLVNALGMPLRAFRVVI